MPKNNFSQLPIRLAIAAAFALAIPAFATAEPVNRPELEGRGDMAEIAGDDAAMNAAIAEAQRSLPDFLARLRREKDNISDIGFKYPLAGWEHIWVADVAEDGDYLTGTLSNIPAQPEYSLGDEVRVAKADISDWAYRDDKGIMQGHFTTRVLLEVIDSQQAAAIKADFGW